MYRLFLFLLSTVLTLSTFGCYTNPFTDIVTENDLATLLEKDGWIILPIPDTLMKPGTVIRYTESDGPAYEGNFSSCGLPTKLTDKFVAGSSPKFESSGSINVNVGLAATIIGIKPSLAANYIKNAALDISSHGSDNLNILEIRKWFNDPRNSSKYDETCDSLFESGEFYVIRNAWRVESGTMDVYSDVNGKLEVPETKINEMLKAGGKVGGKRVRKGKVTFDSSPYYVAFKRIVPLDGQLTYLSTESEDTLLDKRLQAWLKADRK